MFSNHRSRLLDRLMAVAWVLAACLSSCSKSSYQDVIPAESQLVITMNAAHQGGDGNQQMLRSLLRLPSLDNTGLDLDVAVYFFEDGQGNLGLCAKVDDDGQLEQTLKQQGLAVTEQGEGKFCVLPSQWVCGFTADALLLMGPVTPATEADMMQLMAQYFSQDVEQGITQTPLFAQLGSIEAPMALVCQAQALPEQLIAPFTLGAPKTADASQVMISGAMEVEDGCLWIKGRTFSFNEQVNDSIAAAIASYRPIGEKYISSMAEGDAMGLFMNVDGEQFVRLMQQNKRLKQMLIGINTAIDMDNILKSVDGDMALVSPSLGDNVLQIRLAAQLAQAGWLDDVDYWKASVPKGGIIGDWGERQHYYRGDGMAYYFGVTSDLQYFSGGSQEQALQSIQPAEKPIPKAITDKLKGQKMALVLNLSALKGEQAQALTTLLKPMFGNLKAIVYTME